MTDQYPDGSAPRGVDGFRVGALVLASTGGALALVGLTLPWAVVTPATGIGTDYVAQLPDLNPIAAPVAVLMTLIVGVGAGVCFATTGALSSYLRFCCFLLAVGTAVFPPVATLYLLKGARLVVRAPLNYAPELVTVGRAIPVTGCLLYTVGLSLLAVGIAGSDRARPDLPPLVPGRDVEQSLRNIRGKIFRGTVVLAVVGMVGSAILPWYRIVPSRDPAAGLDPFGPDRGDVRLWITAYRVGLVACLALIVLALVTPGAARWLRRTGATVAVAVTVGLALGYALLWRPLRLAAYPDQGYDTLRPGPGHGLGILTMLIVVLGFALLPAGPDAAPARSPDAEASGAPPPVEAEPAQQLDVEAEPR